MSDVTFRDRWIDEVLCTPLLTDTVRVALFAMSRRMDEEGRVSISRKSLAGSLARSERKSTDRITSGIEAGYLERISRGQKYQDATYRATLPALLSGTPGGPAESSQGDGSQPPENQPQRDPRGSREPHAAHVVRENPGGPAETSPYRGTARAHSKHGDRTHQTPAPTGTHETAPRQTDKKVSQSARKREAFRWLNVRYGLTEFEAASVVAEVNARAPKEIRALVPYLDAMKEGDLADIVTAVVDRTTAPTEPDEDDEPGRPLTAVGDWCRACDERTRQIELLDGRLKRCPTCHPLRNQETA